MSGELDGASTRFVQKVGLAFTTVVGFLRHTRPVASKEIVLAPGPAKRGSPVTITVSMTSCNGDSFIYRVAVGLPGPASSEGFPGGCLGLSEPRTSRVRERERRKRRGGI